MSDVAEGPRSYLKPVLLAVDDDCGDLLVHEYKDGAEQSRNGRRQQCPPGVLSQRRDEPAAVLRGGLVIQTAYTHIHTLSSAPYTCKHLCYLKET